MTIKLHQPWNCAYGFSICFYFFISNLYVVWVESKVHLIHLIRWFVDFITLPVHSFKKQLQFLGFLIYLITCFAFMYFIVGNFHVRYTFFWHSLQCTSRLMYVYLCLGCRSCTAGAWMQLKPWALWLIRRVKSSSHCTCMAGTAETCTRVAANAVQVEAGSQVQGESNRD